MFKPESPWLGLVALQIRSALSLTGCLSSYETGIKMIHVRKKYGTRRYNPKILMLERG